MYVYVVFLKRISFFTCFTTNENVIRITLHYIFNQASHIEAMASVQLDFEKYSRGPIPHVKFFNKFLNLGEGLAVLRHTRDSRSFCLQSIILYEFALADRYITLSRTVFSLHDVIDVREKAHILISTIGLDAERWCSNICYKLDVNTFDINFHEELLYFIRGYRYVTTFDKT